MEDNAVDDSARRDVPSSGFSALWKRFVWKPLIAFFHNMVLVVLVAGILMLLVGKMFGTDIDGWLGITSGSGEFLTTLASAAVGAGVFGVILKTQQFSELFQNHIFHVFYAPGEVVDLEVMKTRWVTLTDGILLKTLPKKHRKAAELIKGQFLNEELQYHFSRHEVTYDAKIDPVTLDMDLTHSTRSVILISPNAANPVMTQNFTTDSEKVELVEPLVVNGERKPLKDYVKPDRHNRKKKVFKLPLKPNVQEDDEGNEIVEVEKGLRMRYNLADDPYWSNSSTRYVKELHIKALIPNEFQPYFDRTGYQEPNAQPIEPIVIARGNRTEYRWIIGNDDGLLLPGQGYTIMLWRKGRGEHDDHERNDLRD